jgi:hypothetical protein
VQLQVSRATMSAIRTPTRRKHPWDRQTPLTGWPRAAKSATRSPGPPIPSMLIQPGGRPSCTSQLKFIFCSHRYLWESSRSGKLHGMEDRVLERYVVRPADKGFRVVDVSTGEVAVIAMTPQTHMSEADAAHTAKMLNGRPARGAGTR